jgi:bis(5'-nucleosyl)-tetraphosphatase (symmetrical)
MDRRLFIGDIQGCREELERLLEKLRYDPASDRLEPVGDLVNRGPDSLGVLRLLRSLGAEGVLGNHDLHLLRAARGGRRRESDTFEDVLCSDERDELLAWLAERPFLRADGEVLLVHAGLSPVWDDPPARLAGADPVNPSEDAQFAVLVRYCDELGRRPERDWPPPAKPFLPWYEHWLRRGDPRTVVFGHWARRGLVERERLRGLDTGCVWGGKLTAWIAEEDRLVSVAARRAWAEHD